MFRFPNIYSTTGRFRITMYTNFFSIPEYQSELVTEIADKTHTDVCFDNNNIVIHTDTTCSIDDVVYDTLLNFVDKYREEILNAISQDNFYTLEADVYFDKLRSNMNYLYDTLYTTDSVIIRLS